MKLNKELCEKSLCKYKNGEHCRLSLVCFSYETFEYRKKACMNCTHYKACLFEYKEGIPEDCPYRLEHILHETKS
jgi:hypothetical protein